MKANQAWNLRAIGALLVGLMVVAAGATVPSEQTMVLGFGIAVAALALLAGLNWPAQRARTGQVVRLRRPLKLIR